MRLMPFSENDFWKLFYALALVCVMASVSGCLGASANRSDSKAVKHKESGGEELTWPVNAPDGRNPAAAPMAKWRKWFKLNDSNTKDNSSSVDVSGMLLPAIGIGLLLISVGLFFLNQQTGGMLRRVNQGVVSLWDRFNTVSNLSDPNGNEFKIAQANKAMIESFAAEHNIKI